MAFDKGSTNKLNRRTLPRFAGETLFDRVARAVCEAECLPRKELYESWECARRIRRLVRGGRIREIAGGHGLLSALLILLDDSSPTATVVDVRRPASQAKLLASLLDHWPRLTDRILFEEGSVDAQHADADDLVVSVHACGSLTDRVIDLALGARSRIAILPCCHELDRSDTGQLRGWVDGPLAVDLVRAERLKQADYEIRTQQIPEEITPYRRLLIGWPREDS